MLLAPLQSFDGAAALGGVSDGANQKVSVQAALHQVVLSAGAHGPHGERFIIVTRQNHDRNLGRFRVGANQCVQTLGVGQRQIQQHDVERFAAQPVQRGGQPVHLHQLPLAGAGIANQLREQARIAGVILYQQDADAVQVHCVATGWRKGALDPPIHTRFYLMRAVNCG